MGATAPTWLFWLSLLTALLLVSAAVRLVLARIAVSGTAQGRADGWYLVLWAGICAVFLMWFEGANPELWVPVAIPLHSVFTWWVVAPLCRQGRQAVTFTFAGALFLHNLVGGVAWILDRSGDYNYARSKWLAENSQPGDLIITAGAGTFSRYMRYWLRAYVVDISEYSGEELSKLREVIDGRIGRVYLTDDVLAPSSDRCLAKPRFCEDLRSLAEMLRRRATITTSGTIVTIYEVR